MLQIKTLIVFILFAILFAACAPTEKISVEDFYGVWANKDCEMVRTSKFFILFERAGDFVTASFTTVIPDSDKITYDTRAIAMFDKANGTVITAAKDLFNGDSLLINTDTTNSFRLNKNQYVIARIPQKITISSKNEIVEELSPDSLRIKSPSGRWHELQLVEKIHVVPPYDMRTVTERNLGECLQEWGLTSQFLSDQNQNITTIILNTNQHSYIFMLDNMLYCRAARIRSNNNGTLFAQNIRLMSKPGEFTVYTEDDNLAVTREPLTIDDSQFKSDECTFADEGVYWSLKSAADSTIILNGCGQDYHYAITPKDKNNVLEWFQYLPYEE